ncbi:tomoregulin-1-like [Gigantopelta aegis]|uniref:tomoregulin-1-like n=1 Tax=Gigantopelta aegis TaxID=1735272 RepID=UPI001B88A6CB|nr:tomoregulin-1-like [Gigantopelta aegis]
MWRFITLCCLVAVSLGQSRIDLTIVCKYVSILDCSLFANHHVCGSNHVTYDNHCLFSKAHCHDRDIHMIHNGTCFTGNSGSHGSEATYEFFCRNLHYSHCGTDVEIVCGSDATTYNNFCLFEKARCINRKLFIKEYNACP